MADFVAASRSLPVAKNDWLDELRAKGASAWNAFSFPGRKTEDWKYTSLHTLAKRDVFSNSLRPKELASLSLIENLDANKLVFVNGVFDASLSEMSPQNGVQLVRFSEASSEQRALIEANVNTVADIEKHGFAALNTQCMDEGVLLYVEKNISVDAPIYIVNYLAADEADAATNSRLLVLLETGAEAKLIEHYASDGTPQACFSNAVTEHILGENSRLEYYQILEQEEQCNHIGSVHSVLARNAHIDSFFLSMGTLLTRVDVTLNYAGEGAEGHINGVYLPKGKQHIDFHTCVEHAVPLCQTNENFRGIIADQARAVFNGRIHIHPNAQKTEAYLSNKNLLTSNKAEVDTKPELEIYADDVRCAHGATVSQLEPLSVHYLKTRGISEDEALVMLSFGFINELLENAKMTQVAEYCRPKLAARFSRDPSLMRHLL